MQLYRARETTRNWLLQPVYHLRLAIIANARELAMLTRNRWLASEVWLSPAALAFDVEAEGTLSKSSLWPLRGWKAAGSDVVTNLRGLSLARAGCHEARVTVGELLRGAGFASLELAELIAIETGVHAGFDALVAKLEHLGDYENLTEDLIEPTAHDGGVPVRQWVRIER